MKNSSKIRRIKFFLLLLLSFIMPSYNISAQESSDWQQLMSAVMTIDDLESDDWEDNIATWEQLAQNPININKATREELQQLVFLSDKQIEDIISYVYQYGSMRSLGELAMIESINANERQLLQCFVFLGSSDKDNYKFNLNNITKHGKHSLTLSAQVPFYERKGDKKGYLGYPYRHSFRYAFNYNNQLAFGLTGSQDPGEPFFAGRNKKGYDYYSFYASIANMGRLKKLVVGRYRATFGMGLVMNSDLSFGKMMTLTSLGRRRNALREHTSRSEANYLQGVAASLNVSNNTTASIFASYRKIDATLTPSDTSTIRTLLTSGYHRTESEMQRHNNASETVVGGNIAFQHHGLQLGATAIFNRYSLPLQPDVRQIYRRHYPAGQQFWNISIDYGYRHYLFSVQGETATGTGGSIATVNRITLEPTSQLSFVALQRFYSYKYIALHARSFAEGSRVQNESGVFLGTEWRPTRFLRISLYGDLAHFAWALYQADKASNAYDMMLQATYQRNCWTVSARYSMKNREKNNDDKSLLINDMTHRARIFATYKTDRLSIKTQLDAAANKYKESGKGWMLSEQVVWKIIKPLRLSLSAAYFHTDNYASRLYVNGPGLLYHMSFLPLYGKGIHYAAHIRADISPRLMIIGMAQTTNYFDRDHISSGLQQIDKSSKTDLMLQLKWSF